MRCPKCGWRVGLQWVPGHVCPECEDWSPSEDWFDEMEPSPLHIRGRPLIEAARAVLAHYDLELHELPIDHGVFEALRAAVAGKGER